MNEHSLIARYFAPLAESFLDSLHLQDDAALLNIPPGQQLVITKDAISEGIHYIGNESPALIARKLLRTNLSDLAAMGAKPHCYFLSLALPQLDEAFIASFAEGLATDQTIFSLHLAGGDTVRTQGSPTFSLTALGLVPHGKGLTRSGAKAGDVVYVSNSLGDAALGLALLKAGNPQAMLTERYQLPQPRLALGAALRGRATSCMDISDGLLADLSHLCRASNLGAVIQRELLPLSSAARSLLEQDSSLWPLIYSGGDDYELLFTLPQGTAAPEGCTAIGEMVEGHGVSLHSNGQDITPEKLGYSH